MSGARNRASGFTLVELMIVIAIVAILVTIAIPNLRNLIAKSELKDAAGGLTTALNLARSEAIKRGVDVKVCPIDKDVVAECGDDPKNGWRAFVDTDGDDVLDTGEDLLREWPQIGGGINTVAEDFPSGINYVEYRGNGLSFPSSVSISFDYCTDFGYKRVVEVSSTGRPAIFTDRDGDTWDCP